MSTVYRISIGIVARVVFGISLTWLLLLLFLNYYYNCSPTNCRTVEGLLSPIYWFDHNLLASFVMAVPGSYVASLFWQCAYLFMLVLSSLFLIRSVHGAKRALFETFEFGCFVLTLYGLGILAFAPDWWPRQVTGFVPDPLRAITNEDVTLVSLLAFLITHFSARNCRISSNSARRKLSKVQLKFRNDLTRFVSSTGNSGLEVTTPNAGSIKLSWSSLLAFALIVFGVAMVLYVILTPVGLVTISCVAVSTNAGTGFIHYQCSTPSTHSPLLFYTGIGSIVAGLCFGLIAFHRLFREDPKIMEEWVEEETES